MNTTEINQRTFDAYCKKILRNEARNCYAEMKRRREKEILLSELPEPVLDQFQIWDVYTVEQCTFVVIDQMVVVEDGLIGKYIGSLSKQRRDIILLSYYIGFSDREIGEILGLAKSTVQYQRQSALIELRVRLQESHHRYGTF